MVYLILMTQVDELLEQVINEMRPRLKGCPFRVLLTDQNISTDKPHPWGMLDGHERKQKAYTRMRISGKPAEYIITIHRPSWERGNLQQQKLMLAILIAPISSLPSGSHSLHGGDTAYRLSRRWGMTERIQQAEAVLGYKATQLNTLTMEAKREHESIERAPTQFRSVDTNKDAAAHSRVAVRDRGEQESARKYTVY